MERAEAARPKLSRLVKQDPKKGKLRRGAGGAWANPLRNVVRTPARNETLKAGTGFWRCWATGDRRWC